jgi:uncharacterized protein (DUF2336 family)
MGRFFINSANRSVTVSPYGAGSRVCEGVRTMSAMSALLRDLESSFGTTTLSERAVTLSRLTDLFLVTAKGLTEEQIGIFDVVIGRLASEIEVTARAELSQRLADVKNAPYGVVRKLAGDAIEVAKPVLSRSSCLTDDDLVAIAAEKGRDHMLAMTDRPHLSEPVTDFLVLRGDKVITHAIAANPAARFSRRGMSLLVTRATKDESLHGLLGGRGDVPPELMSQLMAVAKDAARQRLADAMPASEFEKAEAAVNGAAEKVIAREVTSEVSAEVKRFGDALTDAQELERQGKLNEQALTGFAEKSEAEHVICTVSIMTGLGIPATERGLLGPDRDTPLIIGKALKWSWPTVKSVLALRPADEQATHMLDKSRESFDALSPSTAQRVLRFLVMREQAGRAAFKP